MMDLTSRVALVTGASRGIGRATSLALARRGATVVAAARGDNARPVVDEILAEGLKAEWITLDVTDPQSVDAAIGGRAGAPRAHRHPGQQRRHHTRPAACCRMKREDWDAVLATNLTASFTICQAALKPMLKQRGGRVVAISSVVGQMGNAGQANYAASKAGLIGFCKSMAREVASRGITVNVVAPGLIETDMTKALTGTSREDWAERIPLGRLGSPEDVAHAVCFLASDEASYITGHVLAVNGGMYT